MLTEDEVSVEDILLELPDEELQGVAIVQGHIYMPLAFARKYILPSLRVHKALTAVKDSSLPVLTLALYCYSSTAVQLAVQLFCRLRTLLWRQGSYMRPKVSSYRHIEPFLRYLWFKGQPSGSTGKGQTVDPPVDHLDRFFCFFSTVSSCLATI